MRSLSNPIARTPPRCRRLHDLEIIKYAQTLALAAYPFMGKRRTSTP